MQTKAEPPMVDASKFPKSCKQGQWQQQRERHTYEQQPFITKLGICVFQRIIGDAPPTCRSYHLLRSLSCGAFSLLPGFRSTIVTEGPQDVVLLGPLTVKFFKKSSSIGRHSCGDLWPAPQADHIARLKPMCTCRGCCF